MSAYKMTYVVIGDRETATKSHVRGDWFKTYSRNAQTGRLRTQGFWVKKGSKTGESHRRIRLKKGYAE